jgi:hypothetical protein
VISLGLLFFHIQLVIRIGTDLLFLPKINAMNQQELVWEAPQLITVDVHVTLSGSTPFFNENLSYFPSSGATVG